MQYCPRCKVKIRGNKRCCPLCQGLLEGEPESPAFPVIKKPAVSQVSFFRIVTFVLIVLEIAMITLDFLTDRALPWVSLTEIYAVICWADLWIALYFRNNVIKMVTIELYIAMVICLIIDIGSGFRGWSVEWMIPSTFVGMAIITVIIAKILHISLEVYIIYLFTNVMLSLLQLIGTLSGLNKFPAPAVISMALLLIGGAAMALFRSRELKSATGKWFNL
ncbi:MAG: DUF6320 domain-containing protein [Lachnospiraceae bacterium]|jgi:hypothetical protein|nr:DUF6320 domain-containing protein [Lachnospiraceae bacterium]MDD4524480.1 DUF6320 domain-containing protein [Lachnospiraceae bacterium]